MAGCLQGAPAAGAAGDPPPLRVGDELLYQVHFRLRGDDPDAGLNRSYELRVEVLGPGTGLDAGGALRSCLRIRFDELEDPDNTTSCVDRRDLHTVVNEFPIELYGLDHLQRRYTPGAGIIDLRRTPPAAFVFRNGPGSLTDSFPSQGITATGSTVRWSRSDDEARLEGGHRYPPSLENVSRRWSARYTTAAPLPVSIETRGENATSVGAASFEKRWFTETLTLLRYEPGPGPPVDLARDIPTGTLHHQPFAEAAPRSGPWPDRLDPGPPFTRYPLVEAWAYAKEHDPDLQDYLEDGEPDFPASVVYKSIKENEGTSYVYEWNVTLCRGDGSCYGTVSGLRALPGNGTVPYVASKGPRKHLRGPFQGRPLPDAAAERFAATPLYVEEIARSWQRANPDLPLRAFHLFTVPAAGGATERTRLGVRIDHGFITRDQVPAPDQDRIHFRQRIMLSHYDPTTGDPLRYFVTEDPPAHWTEPYVPPASLISLSPP